MTPVTGAAFGGGSGCGSGGLLSLLHAVRASSSRMAAKMRIHAPPSGGTKHSGSGSGTAVLGP
jgi:hypothetical protein